MNIESWIDRLKDECPGLCGRVMGAAEFAVIGKTESPLTPRAYVVPLTETAKGIPAISRHYSDELVYTVGIVPVVRNVADATGESAHKALEPLRLEIKTALCGWKDEGMSYPVIFRAARLMRFNNQILYYGDVYEGHESLRTRIINSKR